VLPISNPANLIIFREHMPALATWLARFALPSALSIVITYLTLRFLQRAPLTQPGAKDADAPGLSVAGKTTGWGIAMMAVVMLAASALNVSLGWPTFAAGIAVFVAVSVQKRRIPWGYLAEISWAVLPLVAGLFVLVEGLQRTGVIGWLAQSVSALSLHSVSRASWLSGITVALASNLINNLPAGLIAGSAVATAHVPSSVASAILIGVDLGPNLSVTGSLATLLWLAALRREGIDVGAFAFLKLGIAVMLPALIAALAALQLTARFWTGP
jgi:arsenical pump membrane protein